MAKERLELSQQLKLGLRINPQQVALGRVLEMSAPEFEEEVRRELDDNPALEVVEPAERNDYETDFSETSEQLQMADYREDDIPSYRLEANNYSPDDRHIDPGTIAPDDGESLIEAIKKRLLAEFRLSDDEVLIANEIIGNLDSNGYLTRSLGDIADDIEVSQGFIVPKNEIIRVFAAIRSLEPAGIGAIDLRDCLLLQLERRRQTVEVITAREILENHFEAFAKKHYDKLQTLLEIDSNALRSALEAIRSLNPKPASALDLGQSGERLSHIIPDVAVEYDDDSNTFAVKILSNIPELGIESTFSIDNEPPTISNSTSRRHRDEALAFIRRKRDDALSFINLIGLRNETLIAIAQTIVSIQREFFLTGNPADIRPMLLKDIAERIGVDLSVVSRGASGKYFLTSWGVFPFKQFFNERPNADSDASTHEVIETLRSIIDEEDKSSPLSDQALRDKLAEKGYDIARRTVAKYRERLGIPVGRLRKQL